MISYSHHPLQSQWCVIQGVVEVGVWSLTGYQTQFMIVLKWRAPDYCDHHQNATFSWQIWKKCIHAKFFSEEHIDLKFTGWWERTILGQCVEFAWSSCSNDSSDWYQCGLIENVWFLSLCEPQHYPTSVGVLVLSLKG